MGDNAERLKQAQRQYLPSGKMYRDATLDDWQEALAIHRARKRHVSPNSGNELVWKQQDADHRYYVGVINEDRQARGLPLIEMM